jgi:hypothetical protein
LRQRVGLDMMETGFFIAVVTFIPEAHDLGDFFACNLFLTVCILLVMCTLQYVVVCESGGYDGNKG